jgi:hypothetical protein
LAALFTIWRYTWLALAGELETVRAVPAWAPSVVPMLSEGTWPAMRQHEV